jgi:hypothetical protein
MRFVIKRTSSGAPSRDNPPCLGSEWAEGTYERNGKKWMWECWMIEIADLSALMDLEKETGEDGLILSPHSIWGPNDVPEIEIYDDYRG